MTDNSTGTGCASPARAKAGAAGVTPIDKRLTKDLAAAAHCLKHGGVIAYPTEYCFGLGCDPTNETAVRRILAMKERPWEQGLIVIADRTERLRKLIDQEQPELLARPLHLVAACFPRGSILAQGKSHLYCSAGNGISSGTSIVPRQPHGSSIHQCQSIRSTTVAHKRGRAGRVWHGAGPDPGRKGGHSNPAQHDKRCCDRALSSRLNR